MRAHFEFELSHAWSTRRFYYASGEVRFVKVQLDAYGCAPPFWKLMDKHEHDLRIGTIEQEFKVIPSVRIRTFVRRDYGYPFSFIGPQRDSDYHED